MSTPRRAFLRHAGASAAALAALPALAAAAPALPYEPGHLPARDWPQERDDLLAALTAAAPPDQPPTAQPQWDTAWTTKLTGKHRAMFDVPQIDGGVGVFRAAIWGRQYMDVLKLPATELSTVIVIRHAAIPLLMTNDFWTTYEVGKKQKIRNERGKTQRHNPVLPDPAANGPGSPSSLDKLIAAGTIVLGCNLAFRAMASIVEKQDKLPPAEARAKAVGMMIPGVILQPSGIFANVMAEEAGCVFVQAV